MSIHDLNKKGFVPIKLPERLLHNLKKSIIADINFKLFENKKENAEFKKIEKEIHKLSNGFFLSKFSHNAQRQLSSHITTQLNLWVKNQLRKKFKFNKSCINYVDKSDQFVNRKLKNKQNSVWYRLVRFNKKKDVGFPHRDNDFWDLGGKRKGEIKPLAVWKIWIPIWGCNQKNTLKFIPGSNLHKIKINHVKKNGRIKPKISIRYFNNHKQSSSSGLNYKDKFNAVFFTDKIVHFAPPNTSSKLRISAEFTVFTK